MCVKVWVISVQVCAITNRGTVTRDVTLDVTSFCMNVCSDVVFLHLCESSMNLAPGKRGMDDPFEKGFSSLCSSTEQGTGKILMVQFWLKKKRRKKWQTKTLTLGRCLFLMFGIRTWWWKHSGISAVRPFCLCTHAKLMSLTLIKCELCSFVWFLGTVYLSVVMASGTNLQHVLFNEAEWFKHHTVIEE